VTGPEAAPITGSARSTFVITRSAGVAALVASAIVVAGCGSSGGGAGAGGGSGKDISVLAIQALSGPLGPSGKADVIGYKAAVDQINAAGGINGRHLKITVVDDAGDPTRAVSLLHDAINSGHTPDILADGTTTAESLAMAPVVKSQHILASSASTGLAVPSPGGAEDVAGHPTKFSTSVSLPAVTQAMVDYLKGKGYHKVAVLAANDAYGRSWSAAYTKAIKAAGLTITSSAAFDPTVLDLTPQMQKLQASNPDVLIAEAYGAATGYVLSSREKLGWTKTPMVGALTFSVSDLTKLADTSSFTNVVLESLKIQQYVAPAARGAKLKAFLAALTTQGPLQTALSAYAFPYDAIWLAADGIRKAGTTDAVKVASAMETLGSVDNTVIQPAYYTPKNHYPSTDLSTFAFVVPGPLVDGMIKS
jgi:branched-chain amino acid transport system substrate-binding protein